ncbi:hypothetical protein Hanom_Chr10g00917871 [Helianthus anomalus]
MLPPPPSSQVAAPTVTTTGSERGPAVGHLHRFLWFLRSGFCKRGGC